MARTADSAFVAAKLPAPQPCPALLDGRPGRATCRKTPEGGGISQGFRHERARPLRAFQDGGRHSRANGDETASPSPRSRVHAAGPRRAWNLGLPSLLGDLPEGFRLQSDLASFAFIIALAAAGVGWL